MLSFDWTTLNEEERETALARPSGLVDPALQASVKNILEAVKSGGDDAVRAFTEKFDGVRIEDFRVDPSELSRAEAALTDLEHDAIWTAIENVRKFHEAQMPRELRVETMPGVVCRRVPRPLSRVGLYVPAGTAPLVSTVIMLAVPAKQAGVESIAIVCPPGKDGKVNEKVLAAASLCGIDEVYGIGGAQAIGALAYGTETIPKVSKIFGPGNAYVALGKSIVAQEPGGPAIDMPAGPSEVMVVADESARPDFVASDLLSQAEHDKLAQVILVAIKGFNLKALNKELEAQLSRLTREETARSSLENMRIFNVSNRSEAIDVANNYAAEHLILQFENPEGILPDIKQAGSVFLGPWSPESVGDYASGTNHVLPTYGAAKAYSGVTLESFMTFISVQSLSEDGLRILGPKVEILADLEGLDAHRNAVSLRLNALGRNS